MERLLTAKQMREADEYTVKHLNIPEEVLIQRAGSAIVEEITKRFLGGRVLVCIGKGNNGEDGKVVSEILSKKHGFSVAVLNVNNGIFKLLDKKYDIIVDCIFGTGLNRLVEGRYKQAIEKINSKDAYVVSCDIPSGLNSDNGTVMGASIKANLTVCIQEYKLGCFLNDGPDYCGETVVRDIGISIWEDSCAHRLREQDVRKFFLDRKRNVNKGTFGKACIIGGSVNYPGSVMLSYSALLAFKTGVGYSSLCAPKSLMESFLRVCPECIFVALDDDTNYVKFNQNQIEKLLSSDAICVGMGMGVTRENYKIIKFLLENYKGKLVIDADGLNTLSKYSVKILKNKKCDVLITPHVLEFSRLSEKEKEEIIKEPIKYAHEFAKEYKVTVLLKSAVSVITDGKIIFINTTGNSGMAKAGSGDVLSGLTCGMLARGLDLIDGATISAYLFGKMGEQVKKEQNEYTMTASDLIKVVPSVINDLF